MTIHRLTFPAPRRCSTRTGAVPATYAKWQLTKKKNSKLMFDFDLTLVPTAVEQSIFTSRPWEEADALRVISNGGWFDWNNAEFASRAAREFAYQAQLTHQQIMEA